MAFHRTLWSLILLAIIAAIALAQCQPVKAQVRREPPPADSGIVAVPEPETYGLMAAGSLFVLIVVRRFKK